MRAKWVSLRKTRNKYLDFAKTIRRSADQMGHAYDAWMRQISKTPEYDKFIARLRTLPSIDLFYDMIYSGMQ